MYVITAVQVIASTKRDAQTISRIAMINNSTQRFVHFMFTFVQPGHENDPVTSWSQMADLDSGESQTLPLTWADGTMVSIIHFTMSSLSNKDLDPSP
jgi:hypothetical protein